MRWLLLCRMVVQQFRQMQANSQNQVEWTRHLLATALATGAQINIKIHSVHCRHMVSVIPWTCHRVWLCRVRAVISQRALMTGRSCLLFVFSFHHISVYIHIEIHTLYIYIYIYISIACWPIQSHWPLRVLSCMHTQPLSVSCYPLQHILLPAPSA